MSALPSTPDAIAFDSLLREHVAAFDMAKELDFDGPHDVAYWRSVFERRFGRVRDLLLEMDRSAKSVIGPECGVAFEITNPSDDGADLNVVTIRRACAVKRKFALRENSIAFLGWTQKVVVYRAPDRRDRNSLFEDCEAFIDALRTAVVRALTSQ